MLDPKNVINQFEKKCTGCGSCVECCPIVSHTELKGIDPGKVMDEILDLFRHKRIGNLARARIYSCLFCNTCLPSCPRGLNIGLSFGVAKAILQELGDPVPKGVASILGQGKELLSNSIPEFRGLLEESGLLITEIGDETMKPVKTVLFASCFGLIQKDALSTALKILQRIDPATKVLGGFDYCCGELQYMAGRPDEAVRQFDKLIEGLNFLSPEKVVIFCPTCNMTFDHHHPDTEWSWHFITDFISENLDVLGSLNEVNATVTIHDPCHFVRGAKPGSDSPREILNAIPGIKIIEMENTREQAICCGAYAITGTGKPGFQFRDRRLKQALNTSADILGLYCPGCHIVLGSEGPNISLRVESILSLLGESLGIK